MDIQTDTKNKSNQTIKNIIINTDNTTNQQKTIQKDEKKYYNNTDVDWSKLTWTLQNL